MNNPQIVTDSIIDSNGSKAGAIQVFPVSIFRYAWLERLESPFIDPTKKFDVDSVIPTAFIFCHTPQVLRNYTSTDIEKLKNDAYEWADKNLELDDIADLIKSITSQMVKLNKAAPDSVSSADVQDDGKKKE